MAEKNINTTVTLKQTAKPSDEINAELARAAAQAGSSLVKILIPEVFTGAFGNPMTFSVNGIRVEIPIGVEVEVPALHAEQAKRMMKGAVLTKTQRLLNPDEIYKD